MARPLRIEYEGAVYHVTARGNERRKIFFSKSDYDKFLHYVAEAKRKCGIKIHCYVLMSNHYHLVIETPEANISRAMHYINSSYTTYINIKRKRSGHLFQGRFKGIVVDRDNYLAELSRYIHLNPVRAKMVQKPEEYIYSSYKAYISKNVNNLLTQNLILHTISNQESHARQEYRRFVESAIGIELDNPLKDTYGGIILGKTEFIKETLRKVKETVLQVEEISNRKALKSKYNMTELIEILADYFNVNKGEIIESNNSDLRRIAIYLIKKNTGATNNKIGNYFGGITYSAVAKVCERFKKTIKKNGRLKRKIAEIERELSKVKVRPL
jgi:putative transposase